MPPAEVRQDAQRAARSQRCARWIAQGAKWEKHWSFLPVQRPPLPPVPTAAIGDRNPPSTPSSSPGSEEESSSAVARGRPGHAPPPRHARPDRPAADAGGSRRLPRATSRPTPTSGSSIGCSRRRATASGWRSAGSTRPATPTRNGYQSDGERVMWRWRDWVIEAFNRNMPFDQFTIEQLAGDLLPNADARPADRHRLQPQPPRQRRGRHHPRGVRRRVRRRPRRDHRHRLARPDARLRPLPRPQVRPVHAEGVLQPLRLLQQRAGEGPGGEVRQLAAGDSRRRRRGSRSDWPSCSATAEQARRTPVAELRPRDRRRASGVGEGGRPQPTVADWQPDTDLIAHWTLDEHAGRAESAKPVESATASASLATATLAPRRSSTGRRSMAAGTSPTSASSTSSRLAAWVWIPEGGGGTIVSRMTDEPQGDGWQLAIVDGKLQVNLAKRWLDDALRVETAATVPRRRLAARRRDLRRLAVRRRRAGLRRRPAAAKWWSCSTS